MNELALFAGAGGGILGGKLLGWKTVCAVEIEDYCRRVLMQRQDDGILDRFPIWDDVQTFNGTEWRGVVDIVTGGFPCQDISSAGKGKGITGERSGLWKEMARIIGEVGPRYVLVENSPTLTSRGMGVVLGDLAEMGYDAKWGVLGAHHAGAPHKRDRIWILAHDPQHGRRQGRERRSDTSSERQPEQSLSPVANACGRRCGESEERQDELTRRTEAIGGGEDVADTAWNEQGRQEQWSERERTGSGGESVTEATDPNVINGNNGGHGASSVCRKRQTSGLRNSKQEWWLAEPNVGRVAHGVDARVDQLKALGNGQVPAVVALAWQTLR